MALAVNGQKYCPRCKETKSILEYNKDSNKKDSLTVYCRECSRRYYEENKEKAKANSKKNFKLHYERIILEYKTKPCADCGKTYPPVLMDFDHVPERGPKLFNITNGRRAKDKLLIEIAKCDVVCAMCHRIRTATRAGLLTEEEIDVLSKL